MISYQVYKLIHLTSIFFFLTSVAVMLVAGKTGKIWKIITGISSFFILLGGMGLMARLQAGFQPWIVAKLVIWFLVTGGGHIAAKRFAKQGVLAYWVVMGFAIAAATLAIYKPF
ncbi:MAG: SirB2 family protein [Oligoflexia bacterium]|nr:SirB2 family protein [Oligoflexia bacterium]